MAEDITVLIVRHPDYPTEVYSTHDIQEIVFDYGASYDITRPFSWDEDDITDDLNRAMELRIEYMDTGLADPLDQIIESLSHALQRIKTQGDPAA